MAVIIVDLRERQARVPALLQSLGAVVVEQHLESGDYLLSADVGVERKTAFDFVTAIIKKRFYLQLEALKQAYSRPLYVIEGRQLFGLRKVHPNFIRGALATVTVTYSIPTVFTQDANDTAELLHLIARREQRPAEQDPAGGAVFEIPRGYRKAAALPDQQLQVLEALPLIGRLRAERLLNHFASITQLAAAGERELAEVPGIGPKMARRIRQVLGEAFRGES